MSKPDPLQAALERLRHACEDALAAVAAREETGLRHAFDGGTELANVLLDLGRRVADCRALIADRIAEEEELSLAKLGETLSMSKSRAEQMRQTAAALKAGRKE